MDENNVSSVNAEPVANVEPQQTTVNEPVNAGSGEIATPQTDSKPVQTPEQNAEYAKVRREAESKAKDQVIAEMYGESYGIYTYADYQKALADQQAEAERQRLEQETGIDPEKIKPFWEQFKQNDPDFQELTRIRNEASMKEALTKFNQEYPELGVKTADDLNKLPNVDKITNYVKNGLSLNDAYFLANKNDILGKKTQAAQQETINKITANGQSSPGSLSNGGSGEHTPISQMSKADFEKMIERVKRGEKVMI